MNACIPPMRSKLFVPGSRPELFAKAMASAADGISIDLEDAVREESKAQARQAAGSYLRALAPAQAKVLIVRVNGLESPHFEPDLQAVLAPALAVINLPKVESPDEVLHASEMLARMEREMGLPLPVRILANIESPRGLLRVNAIAAAHSRLIGLQIGFGDLFEPLSMDRADAQARHHVQFMVRLAAGASGIAAYDGAFAGVADMPAFAAECLQARRLGFTGKSCIHPSQVAGANEAFGPNPAELAFARQVLAAWGQAQASGLGAITVAGRMVDKPFVDRARDLLSRA